MSWADLAGQGVGGPGPAGAAPAGRAIGAAVTGVTAAVNVRDAATVTHWHWQTRRARARHGRAAKDERPAMWLVVSFRAALPIALRLESVKGSVHSPAELEVRVQKSPLSLRVTSPPSPRRRGRKPMVFFPGGGDDGVNKYKRQRDAHGDDARG